MRSILVFCIAAMAVAASAADKAKRPRAPQYVAPPQGPACHVLRTDDIRKITGRQEYVDGTTGDAPGEGIGGGTSCQWSDAGPGVSVPMVSVVLVPKGPGKGYVAERKGQKQPPGCKQEPVADLGAVAFFEQCPKTTTLPLYVQGRGANDLVVALQVSDSTVASAKRIVVDLARSALANMK